MKKNVRAVAAGAPGGVGQELSRGYSRVRFQPTITLRVYAHWLPDTTARKGVERLDSIGPRSESVARALHKPTLEPYRQSA
jgi:hypothetical protein